MKRQVWVWFGSCFLSAALLAVAQRQAAAAPTATAARPIVVFAAASLTDALQELADDFGTTSGIRVRLSFASSSVLARQIEGGAPADVFLSADIEWMNYLATRNLLQPGSRHDLLGNQLVLVASAASTVELKIEPDFDLAAALGNARLATGDPDSVPVGRYARAALTSLGVWNSVRTRIVGAENVRAALVLVDRGEAPLGIVYKTDALIDKQVRIVDQFPADSHPPITYPMALTVNAGADAGRFADFLRSSTADAVFVKFGFVPLH